MAEERTMLALNVSVGTLTITAEPRTETIFFDQDGHPIYQANEGIYTSDRDENGTVEVLSRHRPTLHAEEPPTRFDRASSRSELVLLSLADRLSPPDGRLRGHGSAVYDDVLLFAGDGPHVLDEAMGDSWASCAYSPRSASIETWRSITLLLRGTEADGGICTDTGWDWFVKDFPVAVGRHISLREAEQGEGMFDPPTMGASVGTVDFVPGTIERGDGEVLPRPRSSLGQVPVGPVEPIGPTRALQDLESSDAPLLLDASLADIAALLDEQSVTEQAMGDSAVAPSIRELRDEGAKIVAFLWQVRTPTDDGDDPTDVGSFLDDLEGTRHPVIWLVLLYASEGRWTVAGLATEMGADGSVTLEDSADLCLESRECPEDALQNISLTSTHLAPEVFVEVANERLQEEGPALPGTFHYSPYYEGRNGIFDPSVGLASLWSVSSVSTARFLEPSIPGGIVTWGSSALLPETGGLQYGTYNLADGSEVSDVHFRVTDPAPSEVGEAVADPIRMIEPLPPYGLIALLMLVIAGLSRLIALYWSGILVAWIAKRVARLRRSEVTEDQRRQILEHLKERPGATAKQVRLHLGTRSLEAVHRLESLAGSGDVVKMQDGRRRHYFAAGSGSAFDRLETIRSYDLMALGVLQSLYREPGATVAECARAIERPPKDVKRTARRLERLGCLELRRVDGELRLHARTA